MYLHEGPMITKWKHLQSGNIYINWHSHAPSSSSELLLRNEISYLRNIFTEYNDFPLKVVINIIDQEHSQLVQQETTKPQDKETNSHYSWCSRIPEIKDINYYPKWKSG